MIKKLRRRPIDHEHNYQVVVVRWSDNPFHRDRYPGLHMLFAVPNAGKRSARMGAYYKAEGLRPGAPDLVLPVARKGYHGLIIEMKVPKTALTKKSYRTPEQTAWGENFTREGYLAITCWGHDAAITALKLYLDDKSLVVSSEGIKVLLHDLNNIEVIKLAA